MFLKPFRVKTQTTIKSSDRKKLRSDIQRQYPSLTEEDASTLVPSKDEMLQIKVCTHGEDNVTLFTVTKIPIFYEIFKQLYPTVYTLWKFPHLLPSFRTWPPVFEKLLKGADLMLPGVIPDKTASPKMFGNLQKGDLVTVTMAGNKAPVALGKALMSGEDMYMSALRGKGVGVLHIMGDELWAFGDRSSPPVLEEVVPGAGGEEGEADDPPPLDTLELEDGGPTSNGDSGVGDLAQAAPGGDNYAEPVEGEDDDEEEEEDPVAVMDNLLHHCFVCALKAKVKKSDLPLLTGNFLRNYMQPFSSDKQLDVKKSSFKKFNKFLQSKVSEGYICIKEQSKGVDVITEVDKSHLGLRAVQVPEILEEAPAAGKGDLGPEETYTPLTFTDVYCVNAQTLDLFKEAGLSKGDALIISDIRQHVTNYIKANELQHKADSKQVILDPVLAHTILKPAEGDLDHMNWEQVINRVVGKMQAGVAISSGAGPPTIKKGKLDPIKLEVSMRASQKKVTIVDNLEDYGIDVRVFARLVQRGVASSASVVQSEQKTKGPQVVIQGNQVNFVASFLIDKYKIPRRHVTGLENAPKQKKKR